MENAQHAHGVIIVAPFALALWSVAMGGRLFFYHIIIITYLFGVVNRIYKHFYLFETLNK